MIHRGAVVIYRCKVSVWLLAFATNGVLVASFVNQPIVAEDYSDAATVGHRASDEAILAAFDRISKGNSVDEIVINDQLRTEWFQSLDSHWQERDREWQTASLLRLVSLRKAGKLAAQTTAKGRPIDQAVLAIAEIASRSVVDRFRCSTDELLCDSHLRDELQREASGISPTVDPYDVRKAVLRLRKTRRLQPELVLRVAEWDRTIEVMSLEELDDALKVPGKISSEAGVYLFRDASGYLYIGEAIDLQARLKQHLHESDRLSLRKHLQSVAQGSVSIELHSFGKKSPANQLSVRRAYESELIRTREPRMNVRP